MGEHDSVGRAVLQFALAGLAAVAVFVVASVLVVRELGRREALSDAREVAVVLGQGVVEPNLADSVLEDDRAARDRLDRVVQERVLGDQVVRVKIWTRDGRIVYSDEPRLVGAQHPLDDEDVEALDEGGAHAEVADLSAPENRFERGFGRLYEVYTRVRTPDGTPLLFETYQRRSALVATSRELWIPFALTALAGFLLLWLAQLPLAWRLARRLEQTQNERERLLVRAVEASADERRRIAGALHDGVVQDLAGVSYSLGAAATREPGLTAHAASLRAAIQQLRTLLVEIHPPNLRAAGLAAALRDLLAPLAARGLRTSLDVDETVDVDADTELLLFRAASEAIRNVQRHADAGLVRVSVARRNGNVRLEVVDDGAGFSDDARQRRRSEGHIGLSLLEEVAASRGGRLAVDSRPGEGTTFAFEVPA